MSPDPHPLPPAVHPGPDAGSPTAWLDVHDLADWRGCPRRFQARRRAPSPVPAPVDADPADPADQDDPAADVPLRASYPLGVAIATPRTPAQWQAALAHTAHCLDVGVLHDEGGAIFGACLASDDGLLARIDVLAHGPGGAQVLRRRHATVGCDADIDRVAWWAHVAARNGLRLQALGLLLVDTDFVYPGLGLYAGLYRQADLSPVLGQRPVADWVLAMRRSTRADSPTAAAQPGAHCQACAQRTACDQAFEPAADRDAQGQAVPAPERLALLGRERAEALRAAGHHSLRDVPPEAVADQPRLQRVLHAVQRQRPVVAPAAAQALAALPWPRHLLRLDTIGFAVPRWPGTRPYQVLPFQWTCARLQADGQVQWLHHLAEPGPDPRTAFAHTLLQALGGHGPVLAYNAGFERNRLLELAQHLPEQAVPLQALAERLVDLFQLARASAYHPAQAGSWSFRALAQAVAPELAAIDGLDGADVQALFASTLVPHPVNSQLRRARSALQTHGRRQVMVLQQLLQWLQQPTGSHERP